MNHIDLETQDGELGKVVDDVLSKMARGESVDVEQYAAEHPDVADVLRHAIPALRAVAQSGVSVGGTRVESGGPSSSDGDTPTSPNRTLGDFRFVRELGRGGMGVVYEAEQVSLGRKVALKVLPFAGMVRGNGLQRFHNEVRAAATLDHPNIVSVYSVGEERGVHYYAMQLVRGQSLAEVIQQLAALQNEGRSLTVTSISDVMSSGPTLPKSVSCKTGQPLGAEGGLALPEPTEEWSLANIGKANASTWAGDKTPGPMKRTSGHDRDFYRSIAALAAQAADALEHAHQRGIIHRDIKPGNLMLDAESQLYVTDFGLARIETDAAMTMTGDLIGTLRYMSPEQALAKRVVIDHRSDIYSLGMTLYELLTLQPAFTATDRQELLKQIAFEEPTKPRQKDRSIPTELETIVLKAIEKKPDDRYVTAGEMADDLRAFLEDRPILAKRPTIAQRTVKWSRRNQTFVNTAASTLAAAIAVGGGLLWQERSKTFAALNQATTQQQLALKKADEAQSSQAAAIRQRNSALWNQYCAEMVSGRADQQNGQIGSLEQKLLRHLPVSGQEDRRGWEWYYLFSLCHPEVRSLQGAGYNATWSPDGAYVADCGYIYDAETGSCVRRLIPSWILRNRGKWSPDSKMYAWGMSSDDSCIYIWDRETDDLEEFRGHKKSVWCVDWSPDGKFLASGGMDKEVWIWDVATRAPSRKIEAQEFVTGLAWSADGKRLAAGIKWNRLVVWNPHSGETLVERDELGERGESYLLQPVWHPGGDFLAVSSPEGWMILRRDDWSVIYRHDRQPGQTSGFSVTWRPDGERIAYANDGLVEILDPWDDEVAPVVYENVGKLKHIAWSPDSQKLLASDTRRNKRLKILEMNVPFQPPVIPAGTALQSLSWLPDGETLVGIEAADCSISSWRVADGERLSIQSLPIADRAAWSPNRRFAAVLSGATPTRIEVLDGTTGSVHSIWQSSDETDQVHGLSWSCDETKLAIRMNLGQRTKVEFWRLDDEESISTWALNGVPSSRDLPQIAWSPDSSRVAVSALGEADDNGTLAHQAHVYVVDVASGTTVLKHNLAGWGDPTRVTSLAWSSDNQSIFAGNQAGRVEAVDIGTGQVPFSNHVASTAIHDLAVSPDDRRVVIATGDGLVEVIAAVAGEELLQFQLDDAAHHVSWSPDGKRLAAATGDGTIHTWDATRGFEFSDRGARRGELALEYYRPLQRLESSERRERLKEVLRLAPDTLGYWQLRGDAQAKLGEFEKATHEFSKAIAPGLDRSYRAAIDHGYALLGAGETKAFRDYCKTLLGAFADVEVPSTGGGVAWLCSLTENQLLNIETLVRLSERDVNRNRGYHAKATLGAVYYRDHQYQRAAQTLSDVADLLEAKGDPNEVPRLASTLYFLAMARQQLGHDHQALRILADADKESRKVGTHKKWRDDVQLKVLREQATELIGRASH
ncbi:MAG: protein kinase [Phycisphaera sp. RhM]|nr:protein kinase [Phycisphaera sp. RhM]